MATECTSGGLVFQGPGRREIRADFNGGDITSDAGVLLLQEVERRCAIVEQFAHCFDDHRDASRVEHNVRDLLAQRVFALALGYEDLNDHDELRFDPLLAAAIGKADPKGAKRARQRDQGAGLAGKSTLNRVELSRPGDAERDRYRRIVLREELVDQVFLDVFLQAHPKPPKQITLDLDATDDPLHGKQEGRFFHGYYGHYCYLPLYIFCGEHLLVAKLRQANRDASHGCVAELTRLVQRIREVWPQVRILIRGDSGFCRDDLMAWCESNNVDYLLGLARNSRLQELLAPQMTQARQQFEQTQQPARVFAEFRYRTLDSWSRERRVVGKAEHIAGKANPRFVVTSLDLEQRAAPALYEEDYCARGDMENRIKEQQLMLFADRTSTHEMRSNQLRLWFSSVAYVLVCALRRLGLSGTEMATAQAGTIRVKLFKIAALVVVSVRRVVVRLASACPYQGVFAQAVANLRQGLGTGAIGSG